LLSLFSRIRCCFHSSVICFISGIFKLLGENVFEKKKQNKKNVFGLKILKIVLIFFEVSKIKIPTSRRKLLANWKKINTVPRNLVIFQIGTPENCKQKYVVSQERLKKFRIFFLLVEKPSKSIEKTKQNFCFFLRKNKRLSIDFISRWSSTGEWIKAVLVTI
jgi:hypothetical protein